MYYSVGKEFYGAQKPRKFEGLPTKVSEGVFFTKNIGSRGTGFRGLAELAGAIERVFAGCSKWVFVYKCTSCIAIAIAIASIVTL